MNGCGEKRNYRFTFGPWNISTGADPFGPPVRKEVAFAAKIREYKKLGFDGVQFHDDDVVPADLDWPSTLKGVAEVKKMLDGEGLFCEFIAPRLWEHPSTIDGGYTSNSAADRKYAIERSKRRRRHRQRARLPRTSSSGWPARGPTSARPRTRSTAVGRIVDAVNAMLEHDPNIRILGEMKPNEPMDQAYLPTVGHFLGLAYRTADPSRVGVLIESAHSILAGLDPSDDMAYALWHEQALERPPQRPERAEVRPGQDVRLGRSAAGVQHGLGAGARRLRRLHRPRRQGDADDQGRPTRRKHLANSRAMFLRLLEVVRSVDAAKVEAFRAERDYEGLEMYILEKLLGGCVRASR